MDSLEVPSRTGRFISTRSWRGHGSFYAVKSSAWHLFGRVRPMGPLTTVMPKETSMGRSLQALGPSAVPARAKRNSTAMPPLRLWKAASHLHGAWKEACFSRPSLGCLIEIKLVGLALVKAQGPVDLSTASPASLQELSRWRYGGDD